jgi:hypothetical protein
MITDDVGMFLLPLEMELRLSENPFVPALTPLELFDVIGGRLGMADEAAVLQAVRDCGYLPAITYYLERVLHSKTLAACSVKS